MKKNIVFLVVAAALLSSCNNHNTCEHSNLNGDDICDFCFEVVHKDVDIVKIKKVVSPNAVTLYSFYKKCAEKGYVIDSPIIRTDLGEYLEKIVIEGVEHYFYAAEGYEFI